LLLIAHEVGELLPGSVGQASVISIGWTDRTRRPDPWLLLKIAACHEDRWKRSLRIMFTREFIMKLLRFAVVGGSVTLLFMGLLQLFSTWWGKQLGFFAAYPIAASCHFLLNKWWTFADQRSDKGRQVGEYLLMAALTFALQWVVYTGVTHFTPLAPPIAGLIANVAQMAITFFVMDRRIFTSQAPRS
jgi:putative flippase GtrA